MLKKVKYFVLLLISALAYYLIGVPIYSFGFLYELSVCIFYEVIESFIEGREAAQNWLMKKERTQDEKIIDELNKKLSWLKK